jgi:hypothetical protein
MLEELRRRLADPLLARTQNLWPVDAKLDCLTASDGPMSARVAIIDYNADLDARFAPAELLKDGSGFRGIAGLSNDKILGQPKVERPGQPHRVGVELVEHLVRGFAPMGFSQYLGYPVCRKQRSGRYQDSQRSCNQHEPEGKRQQKETRLPAVGTRLRPSPVRLAVSDAHEGFSSIFLAFAGSALGRTRCKTPFLSVASIRSRSIFSESVKMRS